MKKQRDGQPSFFYALPVRFAAIKYTFDTLMPQTYFNSLKSLILIHSLLYICLPVSFRYSNANLPVWCGMDGGGFVFTCRTGSNFRLLCLVKCCFAVWYSLVCKFVQVYASCIGMGCCRRKSVSGIKQKGQREPSLMPTMLCTTTRQTYNLFFCYASFFVI